MSARAGGRAAAAVAGVLALALAVRLWGIHYGLPWLFYFHDEPQIVLRALRLGTGDLNPHFFIWPATLLLYLALIAYAGLFVVGRLAGWWHGTKAFAAAYFRDPTAFYLLPRLESVAFGVWTVWLAWGFGAQAYSEAVGIAAALGLALNALHAHYSHLAHPVTAMTAFTTLGLWAAWRAAAGGRPRHLYLGALAAGVGVSVQYHAGLLAVPLAVAVLYRLADTRGAERARWLLHGLLAAGLAVAALLVISPYIALDYRAFRADLTWITAKTAGAVISLPRWLALFWHLCLRPTLGLPLSLAAAAGVLLALARRTRADVVLLAFSLAYLLLARRAATLNDRYAIPLAVPALLLAARALESALAALRAAAPVRAWAVAAGMLALVAPLALDLVRVDYSMTRDDTRIAALHWFEGHVPEDEKVVIDMARFWNSESPPLAENRARLEERLAEVRAGLSGAGHSGVYADYYRFRLAYPHHPAYYLRSTGMGTMLTPLDRLRAEGFRWAVVSGDALLLTGAHAAAGDSSGWRWYHALDREALAVARFEPRPWVRLGPPITIYRLDSLAGR